LAVLDFNLFRISVFDQDGVFGRVLRLEGEGNGMVFPGGLFEDGSVLGLRTLLDDGENPDLGAFRDLIEHRRYDRDGRFLGELATLLGSELFRAALPDGAVISTGRRHGLTALTTTGPDSWFYGSSASYEIQEWSINGDLQRVFRLAKERRPTPQLELAEWQENVRGMTSQRRQLWEAVPVAEHLPAYEQILLDRAGNFWTAEYLVLDETPIWQVFGPDGRWLGSVSMPSGGRVSEIGEDYVLGTWQDEMDVETVRMYGLVKPGSQ
jgi:hypothetical protein